MPVFRRGGTVLFAVLMLHVIVGVAMAGRSRRPLGQEVRAGFMASENPKVALVGASSRALLTHRAKEQELEDLEARDQCRGKRYSWMGKIGKKCRKSFGSKSKWDKNRGRGKYCKTGFRKCNTHRYVECCSRPEGPKELKEYCKIRNLERISVTDPACVVQPKVEKIKLMVKQLPLLVDAVKAKKLPAGLMRKPSPPTTSTTTLAITTPATTTPAITTPASTTAATTPVAIETTATPVAVGAPAPAPVAAPAVASAALAVTTLAPTTTLAVPTLTVEELQRDSCEQLLGLVAQIDTEIEGLPVHDRWDIGVKDPLNVKAQAHKDPDLVNQLEGLFKMQRQLKAAGPACKAPPPADDIDELEADEVDDDDTDPVVKKLQQDLVDESGEAPRATEDDDTDPVVKKLQQAPDDDENKDDDKDGQGPDDKVVDDDDDADDQPPKPKVGPKTASDVDEPDQEAKVPIRRAKKAEPVTVDDEGVGALMDWSEGMDSAINDVETKVHPHGAKWWRYRYEYTIVESLFLLPCVGIIYGVHVLLASLGSSTGALTARHITGEHEWDDSAGKSGGDSLEESSLAASQQTSYNSMHRFAMIAFMYHGVAIAVLTLIIWSLNGNTCFFDWFAAAVRKLFGSDDDGDVSDDLSFLVLGQIAISGAKMNVPYFGHSYYEQLMDIVMHMWGCFIFFACFLFIICKDYVDARRNWKQIEEVQEHASEIKGWPLNVHNNTFYQDLYRASQDGEVQTVAKQLLRDMFEKENPGVTLATDTTSKATIDSDGSPASEKALKAAIFEQGAALYDLIVTRKASDGSLSNRKAFGNLGQLQVELFVRDVSPADIRKKKAKTGHSFARMIETMFDHPPLPAKQMNLFHKLELAFIDGAEEFAEDAFEDVDAADIKLSTLEQKEWKSMIRELGMTKPKKNTQRQLAAVEELQHSDEFREMLLSHFKFNDYLREALASSLEYLIKPSLFVSVAMFFFVMVIFLAALLFKISFAVLSVFLFLFVAIYFAGLNLYSNHLQKRVTDGARVQACHYASARRIVKVAAVNNDGSLSVYPGDITRLAKLEHEEVEVVNFLRTTCGWDGKSTFQPKNTTEFHRNAGCTYQEWCQARIREKEKGVSSAMEPAWLTVEHFAHMVQFLLIALGYSASRLLFSPYIWRDYPIIAYTCLFLFIFLVFAMYMYIGPVMQHTVSILAVPPNANTKFKMSLLKIILNDRAYGKASDRVENERGQINPDLGKAAGTKFDWDEDM